MDDQLAIGALIIIMLLWFYFRYSRDNDLFK
jgi:hypothetical protein